MGKGLHNFDEKLPVLSDIEDVTKKFAKGAKGELSFPDWIATMAELCKFSGAPTERLYGEGKGVYDITQGDYLKGALEMMGYSEYRANSALGIEE